MSQNQKVRQWLDELEIDVAQRKVSASALYTQMRYAVTSREDKIETLEGRCQDYVEHVSEATDLMLKVRVELAQEGSHHLNKQIDDFLSKNRLP